MIPRWRATMRLARRDLTRHKARTTLVLLMIALPVAAITSLATLALATHDQSSWILQELPPSAAALIKVKDPVDEATPRIRGTRTRMVTVGILMGQNQIKQGL